MGVSEKLWNGTSELFQVVYSSATAVHMLSEEAYVTALEAHFLVQSALAPIVLQFISPLSLIEQLSTCDVERKYLCYTGNSNDEQFPGEISKYVDASDTEELHTLVEQIEQDRDTTLTREASLKFCRSIARCKEYLSENYCTAKLLHSKIIDTIYSLYKYCETIYSSWTHGKLAKLLDGRSSNFKPFPGHSPFTIC